ncbi:MAG TPA: alpha/beta fold hydrolase [Sphingomonas sp.]|jgi:dipeptidyl aminopeptidase/acylaminoacyl peptidase
MNRFAIASALLLAGPAAAQQAAPTPPAWPHEADIPKPRPVSVPLAGEATDDPTRFFLANGPSAGELSPDGRRLAYVSRVTGQPQLWVVDVRGGLPRQLTFGLGIDGMAWAPDGQGLMYVADKGGDERYGFYWVSADGTRERVVVEPSAAFTVPGGFTADGKGAVYATTARDGRTFDLHVAALDGSGSRLVRQGRMGYYPRRPQPNGTLVPVYESRGETGQDVYLVDLATGRERTLFKPKDASAYSAFAWEPDGQGFYFATDQGRDFMALAHHDLSSGRTRIIEAPAHDVDEVALSPDGRFLLWTTDEGGVARLHARDLQAKRDLPAPALPAGRVSMDFARAAPVAHIEVSGPRTPGEIWVWDLASGQSRRVVEPSAAGLDLSAMVEPRLVTFPARDGVRLSGLLYEPRGAAGRAPVYLQLHGGPSAHAAAYWQPSTQYLLAQGVAVLDFNYRGSTGAGKKHSHLNDLRERGKEIDDVVDAVGWIKAQPGLDGARVAVGGGSYGGYLTNALMGRHPDLFAAGVSQVGVADWVINLERASPQLQASDRLEYGDIRNPADRAYLASLSPKNWVAKIRRPFLVQVGANDPRNGPGEQDDYVTAIRAAGGQVTYRRYPDEGHGIANLPNILDWNRTKAAFLVEHLKPARTAAK